jgi:hypothetical protein
MKKLLLICLICNTIFLQGCDERITPSDPTNGGTGTGTTTGGTTTGGASGTTAQKTTSITRKWGYQEIYLIVDGKKSVIYGPNKITAPNNFSISATPNDYQVFSKDGVFQNYDDTDKATTKGTWKFVDSDKKLNIVSDGQSNDFDINVLTDASLDYSLTVLAADAAKATDGQKGVLITAAFAGVTNSTSKSITMGFKMIPK